MRSLASSKTKNAQFTSHPLGSVRLGKGNRDLFVEGLVKAVDFLYGIAGCINLNLHSFFDSRSLSACLVVKGGAGVLFEILGDAQLPAMTRTK